MGDETTEFASRYAVALKRLERFAASETRAGPARDRAADPVPVLRDALDAVEAVHGTSTQAVRDWPEKQRRVLAQVAALRDELDRAGASDEARRLAAALVTALEPAPGRRRRRVR